MDVTDFFSKDSSPKVIFAVVIMDALANGSSVAEACEALDIALHQYMLERDVRMVPYEGCTDSSLHCCFEFMDTLT